MLPTREALTGKGFCGSSAIYSNWLARDELFAALAKFGWTVRDIAFDTQHGPALALVAEKN